MDDRRVIVIGSGPAGAAAALTLLQEGVPVTMLESGAPLDHGLVVRLLGRNVYRRWPRVPSGYDFTTSGDPSTLYSSALSPGGLSNLWTGATPRFAPEDFTEGERLHERYRWPLGYADLAPYYSRMERVMEVVGEKRSIPQLPAPEFAYEHPLPRAWRRIASHAEEFGQGMVRVPLADGPRWSIRRSGHAFNSQQSIVSKLGRFPHFELVLGAHVTRLRWNPARSLVDGVEYVDRETRSEHTLNGSAVVVAAGPLASTKLLLQSTSADFPDGLGNSQGVLGKYLHDHPNQWSEVEVDRPLPMLDHNVYVSRAPYADSPPLLGAAVIVGALSKWDRVLSLAQRTTHRFGMTTFGTMVPTHDNWVRLTPEKLDDFGQPVLDIHIHFDAPVQAAIDESHRRFTAILQAAGYSATIVNPAPHLIPGWASHYGGTVRMHASNRYGVLNGWNRLHDVDNVVVADASSFTTGVEKNPTLTLMALAARAAHRLADDLKRDALARPAAARNARNALPAIR
jgi:choline dehydrogenase-like flavoprotein